MSREDLRYRLCIQIHKAGGSADIFLETVEQKLNGISDIFVIDVAIPD